MQARSRRLGEPESKLSAGESHPLRVNVVVEIPRGSSVEYELDQSTGQVFDRFFYTATHYPFDYGVIPGTKGEEGDPLDALVLTEEPVYPTTVTHSRTVGALTTEDENRLDAKIVTVPDRDIDPIYPPVGDLRQLPDFALKQVEHFSIHYKESEPGKFMKMGDWKGRRPAEDTIRKATLQFKRR